MKQSGSVLQLSRVSRMLSPDSPDVEWYQHESEIRSVDGIVLVRRNQFPVDLSCLSISEPMAVLSVLGRANLRNAKAASKKLLKGNSRPSPD